MKRIRYFSRNKKSVPLWKNMISSECSSHFIAAYHDLQQSSWEPSINDQQASKDGDGAIRKQSKDEVINGAVMIKNIENIPVIIGDLKTTNQNPQREESTDDVFDSDEDTSSRKDQPLASCDVPSFWKKDMRDRRTSINADFLSPIRMDRLDRSHRRASLNPEGFQGLRVLSAQLQDQRSNASSRSENSVMGFDSEYGGSQSNDSSDNESEPEDKIDFQNITPQSNALLQRRRRLSGVDPPPDPKMLTAHQSKVGALKPPLTNRRMSVDTYMGMNEKTDNSRPSRRFSVMTKKTNLPKIETGGYLVNQNTLKTGSVRPVPERRSSVSPSNFNHDAPVRDVRLNRPIDGQLVRRASRVISKVEQDLIEKELKFLGITKDKKDPLADIRKCRYLRINHDPNNDDKCPCNKCEKESGTFSPRSRSHSGSTC
ncbi:uncharacterized protein [Clytia hemisphaerica]|uniref:Uncharacterized protein n=1 Tax=Clytia hemisphaerica TaxID=252671 RepID=A0A7M5UWN5_9CNID